MLGWEYRASLADGRRVYLDGILVEDVAAHPILGPCADRVATGYDRRAAADADLLATPKSAEELRARLDAVHGEDTLTRVTHTSLLTLCTARERLGGAPGEVIGELVADFMSRDVRVSQCITDAKGDRSLRPRLQPDPDSYLRIVDRDTTGVVVRGAKMHVTAASLSHELMVIPTKTMRADESEYAVACCIPANAEGVTIIDASYARRPGDPRSDPISASRNFPDAMVVFDDVHVPYSRIMLDSDPAASAVFAHSLGLWERIGGLSAMIHDAEVLVGLARLVAEANGLLKISHVKDKLTELANYATLTRATLEAAIATAESAADGSILPDELFVNVGKYYAAANYNVAIRHLHDIAGGSVITAPGRYDLENPEVGRLVEKYMAGATDDGTYRTALFQAVRDATASDYGGWKMVSNLQGGGGLYAQQVVTRKHFDWDHAKTAALRAAGLGDSVE